LALASASDTMVLRQLLPDVALHVESHGAAFAAALASGQPRLAILICPPGGAAELRLVSREREARSNMGAVVLSGHTAVAARIHALQLGFDDALDLTADPIEISARLSLAGRLQRQGPERNVLAVAADCELDLRGRTLWRQGVECALRPREFELLAYLVKHPGRAFTRDELRRRAWPNSSASNRMIDVTVCKLRTTLELERRSPRHLVTVPRSGYRFDPPRQIVNAMDITR
jgi:two-component system response regulator ResD